MQPAQNAIHQEDNLQYRTYISSGRGDQPTVASTGQNLEGESNLVNSREGRIYILTHRIDVGKARAVAVDESVSELRGASQGVEHVDDGGGDLGNGAVVGGGGVDDVVQQGADDSGVVT